jgi:hypothetical protein
MTCVKLEPCDSFVTHCVSMHVSTNNLRLYRIAAKFP